MRQLKNSAVLLHVQYNFTASKGNCYLRFSGIFFGNVLFLALDSNGSLWLYLQVPVVAAAVIQACSGAARGFAASLYDRPNGMELAIFNDLCFC